MRIYSSEVIRLGCLRNVSLIIFYIVVNLNNIKPKVFTFIPILYSSVDIFIGFVIVISLAFLRFIVKNQYLRH